MTEISLSTVVFDGHSLETAFHETAALGFALVEPAYISGYMDFDEAAFEEAAARRLRSLLARSGLRVAAVSAHMDLGGRNASAMIARRLRFAAAIGAGAVITNAAARSDVAAMERCLDAAIPEAEAAGVTIALENPGNGRDAVVADGASGAALVARFGSNRLRLNYDCANVLTYSEGAKHPANDIGAALPALAHVHLKDARRTADGWAYVALGDGDAGLDAVAAKIAGSGAAVGIELPLRLDRPANRDPVRLRPPLPLDEIRQTVRRSLDRAVEWFGRPKSSGRSSP